MTLRKSSSGSVRISESFVIKSINVEVVFLCRVYSTSRVEFFKIGNCDFTFIREMRVRFFVKIYSPSHFSITKIQSSNLRLRLLFKDFY